MSALRALAAVAVIGAGCRPAPAPPRVEEGQVEAADGARLFYRKLGEGRATVLVPLAFVMERDFARLARGRTVVFYDPRNRGRSTAVADDARISVVADAEDLEAVRARLGAERVVAVGFSYLGVAVAEWARRHPEHVERLVQVGPAPRDASVRLPPSLEPPPYDPALRPVADQLERMKAEGVDRQDPAAFCRAQFALAARVVVARAENAARVPESCGFERELPASVERHFRLVQESLRALRLPPEALAAVRAPVLVVHGRRDVNAPYGYGRDWALAWRDARLVSVDAAHASWLDDPAVLDDVERFVGGAWPARAERIASLE